MKKPCDVHFRHGPVRGALERDIDAKPIDQASGRHSYRAPRDLLGARGIASKLHRRTRALVRGGRHHVACVEEEGDLDDRQSHQHQERDREDGLQGGRAFFAPRPSQQLRGPQTVSKADSTSATRRPRATPQIATTSALVISTMSTRIATAR
jgi:hypothetical protein